MLQLLIDLCVRRRWAAIALTLAIGAYGVHALLRTPIEAFPDVTNLQVNVIAQMPGLAPEEVERQITVPLERVLNGVPGMLALRSESLFGLSLIAITFNDDADAFRSRALVGERLSQAELPPGVEAKVGPDATPLGEVFQYRVASDRHDLHQLRSEQEFSIARHFRQVPGVADVVSFGGYLKELHVEVDPDRLRAWNLTLADVTRALEASNRNVSGGFLRNGQQELVVRSVGYIESVDDLRSVVLRATGGVPVTVGDVARIVKSHTPRRGTVGFDLEADIVEGFVLMRRGENPSAVLEGIHEKVQELNGGILPAGMRIEPFYDRAELVGLTVSTVWHNLLFGALLVVSVVWLFLRTIRGSFIIGIVIPLSLLVAFTGLYLLGLPANLISMGAIDFGIVLDGVVIIVENVIHEMRARRPQTRREMRKLVARASAEVARPALFAILVILAALLPVFTLERVEGRIFRPLALTYSFALLGALVFGLTVVPTLCALLLRPRDAEVPEPKGLVWLRARYARVLEVVLRRRTAAMAAAGALLASGGIVGAGLGSEFLPKLDEGDLVVFVEMPPSIALDEAQEILVEVRRRFMAFPEVRATLSEHGRPEDGTDNEGSNMSETFVRIVPREQFRPGWDKERLVDEMRASVADIPGVRFNFSHPIKDNIEESGTGVRGNVVLKVFGSDLEAMRDTLVAAKEVLAGVEGVVDLDLYRDAAVPQLQLRLDRGALARAGVLVDEAQDTIETALAGKVVTEFWENERPVPVRVRLPRSARNDPEDIGRLAVATADGGRLPLREVAEVRTAMGRASINREANSRFMALKFNVEGRDMGSTIAEAMKLVGESVTVPDGHFLRWGGEFEDQQRALARLKLIVPIALGIVLALLASALGNLRSALTILLVAPFAMTGGVFGLRFAEVDLSVSAAVGFIALLGEVSLASLVVLSAVDAARREGTGLFAAVTAGALKRFRAQVMVTLLAMLGMLPMALSTGVGSEIQRPFAVVMVGGMATSLFVVLFVLPVLYTFTGPRTLPRAGEEEEE